MCSKCPIYQTWEEFYTTEKTVTATVYKKGTSDDNLIYSSGSVYVYESQFYSLAVQDNGGAIYYQSNNDDNIMLIEDCVFNNCKSKIAGGAIYKGDQGQNVIQRVCGSYCQSNGNQGSDVGPFCYTFSTQKESSLNYIFDSTISLCSGLNRGLTIAMGYGKLQIKNTNISQNIAFYCSALYMNGESSITGIADSVTIVNNTATSDRLIEFNDVSDQFELIQSNIIHNSQETTNFGLIRIQKRTRIINTNFYGNKGILFYASAENFEFESCTFEEGQNFDQSIASKNDNKLVTIIEGSIEYIAAQILNDEYCLQLNKKTCQTCIRKSGSKFHVCSLFNLFHIKF